MFDTHCHLLFPPLRDRTPQVLQQAQAAGVTGVITVATTCDDALEGLALARAHAQVWCTAGVHPLQAAGEHRLTDLLSVAGDPRCVAWGEIGLDAHHARPTRQAQARVLGEQLALIERADTEARAAPSGRCLPVVLHCRDAFDDLLAILRRTRIEPQRFVFHCFTGTPAHLRRVLDFGAMVSFTGVVTYRNAREVREAARLVPPDRLMVETDAPYLPPEPQRGRGPCEPWMASLTARTLAELRGEDWDRFHAAINQNTHRFFGVPAA